MTDHRMKIEDIDPELQRAFSRMPKMRLDRTWVRCLARRMPTRRQKDPNVIQSKHKLTHEGVRIYQPKAASSGAGLFWIHGGGMIIGKAEMNDPQCNHYARELGLTVVSADYRLAPDHPYPAAIDDCYEAWLWFLSEAERLGVDTSRIAIAGQSAGGGLAAALCQRIRDTGGVQPAAQLLIYPMLDDRTAQRAELTAMEHILWNNRSNMFGWSSYLGHEAGTADTLPPWSVPARQTDLCSLPPAWIGVGDKDLFLQEDKAYAEALKAAGIATEFIVAEKAPHAFEALVPEAEVSIRFRNSSDAFLRKHLSIAYDL